MNVREQLAAIVQRLEAIEKIFREYSTAINTAQERNRENPQSVRAEITFDDASKRETQTEANRQHGTQEKIARYAFYAFLAAVLYAGIAGLQLYEMRIQTAQLFRQFDSENNDASEKAVQWAADFKNARNQVKAAQGSVTAIQQQTIQMLRPWISVPEHIQVTEIKVSLPSNPRFAGAGFILPLSNLGKSPAIVMDPLFVFADLTKSEIRFWKANLKDPDLCKHPGNRFKTPVFPEVTREKRVEAFVTESNIVNSIAPPYNLSGCIVYFDSLGRGPYTTRVVYSVTYSPDFKTIKSIDLGDIQAQ